MRARAAQSAPDTGARPIRGQEGEAGDQWEAGAGLASAEPVPASGRAHRAQLSQAAPGKHHQALDTGSDNDKSWAHNIQGKFLMCPICALTEQSGPILACQFSLLGFRYIVYLEEPDSL